MADLVKTGVFTGDALKAGGFGEPEVAADLAEAGRVAGFAVPAVDPSALPAGVDRTPADPRHPGPEARVTFDRDRALDYLRRNGRPGSPCPSATTAAAGHPGPGGGRAAAAGCDGGPALLVGKAGTLGLDTEGAQPGRAPRGPAGPSRPARRHRRPPPGHRRLARHPAPAGPLRRGTLAPGHRRRRRGVALRRPDGPAQRPDLAARRHIWGWPACSGATRPAMSQTASADQMASAGTSTEVPAIATSGLHKAFGSRVALHDLTLRVEPGRCSPRQDQMAPARPPR